MEPLLLQRPVLINCLFDEGFSVLALGDAVVQETVEGGSLWPTSVGGSHLVRTARRSAHPLFGRTDVGYSRVFEFLSDH